jgi:hypothetical protein
MHMSLRFDTFAASACVVNKQHVAALVVSDSHDIALPYLHCMSTA